MSKPKACIEFWNANELSIAKWDYFSKYPTKTIEQFLEEHPEYPQHLENDCAWCNVRRKSCTHCALVGDLRLSSINEAGISYRTQKKGKIKSTRTVMVEDNGCANGNFVLWMSAEDPENKRRYAEKILDMLLKWKVKHRNPTHNYIPIELLIKEEKKMIAKKQLSFRNDEETDKMIESTCRVCGRKIRFKYMRAFCPKCWGNTDIYKYRYYVRRVPRMKPKPKKPAIEKRPEETLTEKPKDDIRSLPKFPTCPMCDVKIKIRVDGVACTIYGNAEYGQLFCPKCKKTFGRGFLV